MPKITFINPDGSQIVVDAAVGSSLMQAAINQGVNGIVAECGGACQCATCHIYIEAPWSERLPPVGDQEDAMLDNTVCDRRQTSRLSCEITVASEHDGLAVRLPARQI